MGGSILLLFLLAITVAYGLCWLLFLALFVSGRRKKSQLMTWVGGAFLALQTVIGIKVGYDSFSIWKPGNVYKITFGSSPPSDVTNIKSYYYYFGDSGRTYLKFNASPSTIKKLTAKGWNRLNDQELTDSGAFDDTSTDADADDDTPNWFKPNVTKSTIIYTAEHRIGDFARESEILTYDTKTQQVYYDFIGID